MLVIRIKGADNWFKAQGKLGKATYTGFGSTRFQAIKQALYDLQGIKALQQY